MILYYHLTLPRVLSRYQVSYQVKYIISTYSVEQLQPKMAGWSYTVKVSIKVITHSPFHMLFYTRDHRKSH